MERKEEKEEKLKKEEENEGKEEEEEEEKGKKRIIERNEIKRKKKKLEQLTIEQQEVYYLNLFLIKCFKDFNLNDAIKSYRELKNRNIYPSKDTLNNFLAFAAGLGEQGCGNYPIRVQEPPYDIEAAFEIYEDAKRLSATLSEASYSGLIRCCAQNNRKEDGLKLLNEMQSLLLTPRNRTYSSLLTAYCNSGDLETSLQLFNELQNKYNLSPLEKDYISILQLALSHNNSLLFYSTFHSMMEDLLVPTSEELWNVLIKWFEMDDRRERYKILTSTLSSDSGNFNEFNYNLKSIELTTENKLKFLLEIERAIIGNNNNNNTNNNNNNNNSDNNGIGDNNNNNDNDHQNNNESIEQLSKQNLEQPIENNQIDVSISSSIPNTNINLNSNNTNNTNNNNQTESKRRRKPNKIMKSDEKWNEYKVWLNSIENEIIEFTNSTGIKGREKYIIIDGANIGYYQQNYSNAPNHINYHQIHSLIHYLLSLNYIPILILHCRHVMINTNKNIPSVNLKFINKWKNLCRFYITPSGYNDDIYWLYTTVKLGLHIITNDEMRDHHFQMLQSKYFIRWKDRHQIHFKFGKLMTGYEWKTILNNINQNNIGRNNDGDNNSVNDNNDNNDNLNVSNDSELMNQRFREVEIFFPLKYSNCMQIYYNKLNNGNDDISEDFKGNNIEREGYFIPLQNRNEWLCILPKTE